MISSAWICRELIARTSELAFLLAALAPRTAPSSPVVVLRGEAGVGKSRLVGEFASEAERRGARAVVRGAREYARAPYRPFVEAFRALGLATALGQTDASGQTANDEQLRRFVDSAEACERLSATFAGGLAIVIEDLQWADAGTLDFLRFLASRHAVRPPLFVATYRSESLENDAVLARAIASLERAARDVLTLNPLDGDAIEALLGCILRETSRSLAASSLAELRELSDGRPLFAEELLRGMLERIDRDGDARAVVPTSIRAAVQERFRALDAEERDVLVHASVLGRRFRARFLPNLAGFDIALVYRALRHARDLQLVVETDGDGELFAFRHALTREVIYGEMLRAESRELHARAAAALAREQTIDLAAIAEHTYRARDAEHATAWNERAGDEAAAVYAHADAERYFARAWEFAPSAPDRARLARKASDAAYAAGFLEASATWLARAVESADDDGARATSAIRHARVLWELRRYSESVAAVQRFTDEGVAPPARVEALVMLAAFIAPFGELDEAARHLRAAEALLDHAEPRVMTLFHSQYGYLLGTCGQPNEARRHLALAISRAADENDDNVLFRALNNSANVELHCGTTSEARRLYARALHVAERSRNRPAAAQIATNDAGAALVGGALDDAARILDAPHGYDSALIAHWRTAVGLRLATLRGDERSELRERGLRQLVASEESADHELIAFLAGALAWDALAERRAADAAAFVRRAFAQVTRPEPPHWLLAAALWSGDAEVEAHAAARLRTLPHGAESMPVLGLLALAQARAAVRKRRRDEARAHAERAADAFHAAEWTVDEAFALELAGRSADALALFRRCGAHAEVRRLTGTEAHAPRRRGDGTLTRREREIAAFLIDGGSARTIADTLIISERTVETHVASIYRKLGVSSRAELATLLAPSADT